MDECLHGFDDPENCRYCLAGREIVWATKFGQAFHSRKDCVALLKGQDKAISRGFEASALETTSRLNARARGLNECHVCIHEVCLKCAVGKHRDCDPTGAGLDTCSCYGRNHG
jgi:hypothetical protein